MNETFYGAPIKGNDTEAIWSIGHVFPFANSLHWFPWAKRSLDLTR